MENYHGLARPKESCLRLSNDESLIASIPAQYQAYHRKRITEIHEDMNWDVGEDFHRDTRVASAIVIGTFIGIWPPSWKKPVNYKIVDKIVDWGTSSP